MHGAASLLPLWMELGGWQTWFLDDEVIAIAHPGLEMDQFYGT